MSKLSKILQKAGLIEREEEPAVEIFPEAETIEQRYSSVPSETPAKGSQADDYVLPEGVSIELIYQEASVPQSTYTVERLGKLIDGLKQLDPATQRAAILAMDSADDAWSIEDILQDAGKKTKALAAYADLATAKASRIQENIGKDVQRMTSEKDKLITDIQAQISELQHLIESTVSKHAAETAKLNAQSLSAQQAADRERQRLSAKIDSINALILPFNSSTPNS